MNSDPSSPPPNWTAVLRDKVNMAFSLDDLHGLAMDFGLDYDALPGESKQRRVVELIEIMARRRHVPEFIKRCHELNPRGDFQSLLEAAQQEPLLFQLEDEIVTPETAVSRLIGITVAELLKKEGKQYSKPSSSESTRVEFGSGNRNSESWVKTSKISTGFNPSKIRHKYEDNNVKEAGKSPMISRLHGDIEQLEAHIILLGEINGLLESIRNKIGELSQNIKVQHQVQRQMLEYDTFNAARESNVFQGEQKVNSQVNKSAMGRQPSVASSYRGVGRITHYSKPS